MENIMVKSSLKSSTNGVPPKIKKRETKTKSRLFRFTESNYKRLEKLAGRYDTDVSKIMDLLIEVSNIRDFEKALDKYVVQRNPA